MFKKKEKTYRLPSDFGGDVPFTEKERKFYTKVFYAIPVLWVAMMIMYVFSSCEPSKQEIKESITELNNQKNRLQSEISNANNELSSLHSQLSSKLGQVDVLQKKLEELKIYEKGKIPKYILKLHLKQSHFSLSIKKHIKDAMNAIDFEMPVDKEFYNNVSIGSDIVDNFRVGSCVLYGSFGDWKMTVKGKEIRE